MQGSDDNLENPKRIQWQALEVMEESYADVNHHMDMVTAQVKVYLYIGQGHLIDFRCRSRLFKWITPLSSHQ